MELILQILQYGKLNPNISISVVFIFLFIYSVIILRKRRVIKDLFEADIKDMEQLVAKEQAELNRDHRASFYARTAKNEPALAAIRKGSRIVDSYNHLLLAGLAWAVPVYFLWAPLLVLTLPVGLALACVYPDKLRKLISKTVDSKPVSE